MESIRIIGLDLSITQLSSLLNHDEMDKLEIEYEIANLKNKILILNFNLSIKITTIDAIKDILLAKNIQQHKLSTNTNNDFDYFKDN